MFGFCINVCLIIVPRTIEFSQAIEGCCARLDVALFNAILRDEGDDVPTDPISDPVSDPSVLPISPGGLSFGGGSQLKNVVRLPSLASLFYFQEPGYVIQVNDINYHTMLSNEWLNTGGNLVHLHTWPC